MKFTVYLAGEIHTDWRDALQEKAKKENLPFTFVSPQTNHDRSDDIGEAIIGEQPNALYRDKVASDVNNFRTTVLLNKADIVIAQFGEQYRQWNTAMDVTTAINLNKPTIIIRPDSLIHPLKELSNKVNVTVESVDQAIDVLKYIFE
ncbi:MAG TPA: YtoQ family protein [Pseudogracilibacillus sp.]|nr:YtoQ family protein [Pseudogracilibacillus sp.]